MESTTKICGILTGRGPHPGFCRLLVIPLLAGLTVWAGVAAAKEVYISPTGSNSSDGSLGSPYGTFDYAIDQLSPGDTLWVRGGTYNLTDRVRMQSGDGGTSGSPVNIWAYGTETPVLDFSGMSAYWGSSSGRGIQIDDGVDWVHIKGLTIQNARDNGLYAESKNNVFEQLVTRWNADSGLQLSGSASNNLILNSDSYENYDPQNNGENADGFALKFSELGPGNVVRGCRAWSNSDDGWDMWESTTGGVLVEDSWSFDNGKIIQQFYDVDALEFGDLTTWNFNGDGNGFKLGQDGGPHVLNNVLVWENQVRGIDVNGNGYGVTVNNATVYNSGRNWQFDETSSETLNQHLLTNNISFAGTNSDTFYSGVTSSHNTWNGIPADAGDFLSLDDTIARGPRQADGSLPESDFLKLVPGSNLIDAGIDVGLPYNGAAPDLGAFETTPIVYADGDFDEDGDVDDADLASWRLGLGTLGGAAHSDGDADDDGDVDTADLMVWQRDYTGPAPLNSAASPVPEPSSLAGIVVLVLLSRCGRGLGRKAEA